MLTEISNKIEKCTKIRSTIEKLVIKILENEGDSSAQGFYSTIDSLKKKNILSKDEREVIGSYYSFISKLIHEEKEISDKNLLFGISGIFKNIELIINRYLEWKKEVKEK